MAWYETLDGIGFGETPYLAPAHLGRARALEALGREEEAAGAYERFLELWVEADEACKPKLEEARGRLGALAETEVAPESRP